MDHAITMTDEQLEQTGRNALTEAQSFQVTDVESHAEAQRRFKGCRDREKAVEAFFYDGPNGEKKQGMIPKARAAWDAAVARYKDIVAPFAAAARLYEDKGGAWKRAEDARLERERWAREAEARKQAEDEALARAEAEQKAGNVAAAEEIIQAPVYVPPVAALPAAPKTAGVATTKYYSATVTSLEQLILAAAESIKKKDGRVPLDALKANDTFLNGQARLTKREGPLYPGVVVISREGMSSR